MRERFLALRAYPIGEREQGSVFIVPSLFQLFRIGKGAAADLFLIA